MKRAKRADCKTNRAHPSGQRADGIRFTAGRAVNGARVTQADIVASNGVVHAIDAVILPKNWQLLAVAA